MKGMHLLLIEDDSEAARYLASGLRESGYSVDIASDGRDGLDHATKRHYDLIIADRQLPQLDGLSIVQTLRGRGNKVPVLNNQPGLKVICSFPSWREGQRATASARFGAS